MSIVSVVLTLTACAAADGLANEVAFPAPPRNSITFWGHACCYVDVDGFGIVTDPVFDRHIFPRWRKRPAPPPESYAAARLILITHAHPDHLSPETLAGFPPGATVLCPLQSAEYLSSLKQGVKPLNPGDSFGFPGGSVIAVPARHAGKRYSFDADDDGRALGYVIVTAQATIYVSGDTGLFPGMEDIGARHAPDVAILSLSGHLQGPDAAQAARMTGAKVVVPIHWGTYGYLFFPARSEPRDFETLSRLLGPRLRFLRPGESLLFEHIPR